jgi:hypothetical protein
MQLGASNLLRVTTSEAAAMLDVHDPAQPSHRQRLRKRRSDPPLANGDGSSINEAVAANRHANG